MDGWIQANAISTCPQLLLLQRLHSQAPYPQMVFLHGVFLPWSPAKSFHLLPVRLLGCAVVNRTC